MNRAWIAGLALASAAGTAGAAFAGVATGTDFTAQETQRAAAPAEFATPHDRTIDYQVGAAGTVSVSVAGSSLSVAATGGTGWTVVGATAPGPHVEVQFSDTLQLVTFAADLVDDDVVVSLTSVPAPGAPATTVAAAPITVTVVNHASVPKTSRAPSIPATTAPSATEPAVTKMQPSPAVNTPYYDDDSDDDSFDDSYDDSDDDSDSDDDHEDDHGDEPEEHEGD